MATNCVLIFRHPIYATPVWWYQTGGEVTLSVVRPEKVDVLHVEAKGEVALNDLDPVAARALGVLELAERQGKARSWAPSHWAS